MKRLDLAGVSIALVVFNVANTSAFSWDYPVRYGGSDYMVHVGAACASTTLNAAVTVEDSNGNPSMTGAQVYLWSPSSQTWKISTWDDLNGVWSTNLTIAAGAAMEVKTATITDGTLWHVKLTGTVYTGTIGVNVYPGWNFLCCNWDGVGLPLSPMDGDKIEFLWQDANYYTPLDVNYWLWCGSRTVWVYEPDGCSLGADKGAPYFAVNSAYWYYNNTSTTRSFNQTF